MFYSQLLCSKSIIVWHLLEQSQTAFALTAPLCLWKNTAPPVVVTKSLVGGWSCIILASHIVSLNWGFFSSKRPASGNKRASKPGQCMFVSNRKQALPQNSPAPGFEFRHPQTCPALSSIATHSGTCQHCS